MTLPELRKELDGELFTEETIRRIYATDASAYRELPEGVVLPKTSADIVKLVNFARENKKNLIPRAAGTSLAGQVVGNGIVVDISKYLNKVLEVNTEEEYVVVQPGIVRDDLNKHLQPYGYFCAPETATANRAMIGGMIGNNSCGANSIVYGSTREHLLELKTVLADGSEAWFGDLDEGAFIARCNGKGTSGDLHTNIYLEIKDILGDEENRRSILEGYPKYEIPRRNTGYALDMLLRRKPYDAQGLPFNFCQLLAGSEGTLAFTVEAKLKLTKIPDGASRLVCIHCESIDQSLHANIAALEFQPTASELMDHYILDATKRSLLYQKNRFFVEGDPKAILMVELMRDSEAEVDQAAEALIRKLTIEKLGYAMPVLKGDDMSKAWGLRKAGLGLISNMPGDAKPAPVIEDTAVNVYELPSYIAKFNDLLKKHGLYSVHYAHAGDGELHLRPILNLKTEEGHRQFRMVAEEIADLVKSYNGSLSGEHGDGRLRGEFIPRMLGDKNYELCKRVKKSWDPDNIFNPGKIVNTAPMDSHLRFDIGQKTPEFETVFDFSENQGYVRAFEQCNGAGDCRKTHLTGGTMCPSYMATKNEKDTTRARANILREIITKSDEKPFTSPQIKAVMDLCLSCKGCKSECPSNVDITKLKAEWLNRYQKENGIPFRTRIIGNFAKAMKLASGVPWAYNIAVGTAPIAAVIKLFLGFAPKRSMPTLSEAPLTKWFARKFKPTVETPVKAVYFYFDEFTDLNDSRIGRTAISLLDRLGYAIKAVRHPESGRSYLSKGMLDKARPLAKENVDIFSPIVSKDTPLVGLEPSAILTFRDEYVDLLRGEDQENARRLAENVFTIDEFLAREMDHGNISSGQFHTERKTIKVHGHCHQKSLSSMTPTKKILKLPGNYDVQMIPSGCCGMAGSFGYEKEHYNLSMDIGELVLFPAIRKMKKEEILAANGTSCRHQIKDGTGQIAKHPVEILLDALI